MASRISGRAILVVFAVLGLATLVTMYVIRHQNEAERKQAARFVLPPLDMELDVACLSGAAAVPVVREAECNPGGVLAVKRVKADPDVATVVWALVSDVGVEAGELREDGDDVERNLPQSGEAHLYVFALGRRPEKVDPREMLVPLPERASRKTRAAAIHGWAATLERRGIHARVEPRDLRITR